MTLGGCATSGKLAGFDGSAEQTTASATAAGECQRIADPAPPVAIRTGDDAKAALGRYQAGIGVRDRKLAAVRSCADTQDARAAR